MTFNPHVPGYPVIVNRPATATITTAVLVHTAPAPSSAVSKQAKKAAEAHKKVEEAKRKAELEDAKLAVAMQQQQTAVAFSAVQAPAFVATVATPNIAVVQMPVAHAHLRPPRHIAAVQIANPTVTLGGHVLPGQRQH